MPKKFKLYINREAPIEPAEIVDLQSGVKSKLSPETEFDVITTQTLPTSVDWSRFWGDPPHPSRHFQFLTQEIDGVEFMHTQGGGSVENLPPSTTILNWIEGSRNDIPPKILQSERTERHVFEVNDTRWKHGGEEYVYKYCSWEVARDYVLSGPQTLRFSDIMSMNDPLEFGKLNIPLYGGSTDNNFPLRVWEAFHKVTKFGVRFFCSTLDRSAGLEYGTSASWRHAIRGFDHPAMWNHYADKHEGVCLILKKAKLDTIFHRELNTTGNLISAPIEYVRDRSQHALYKSHFELHSAMVNWSDQMLHDFIRQNVMENPKKFFFTKTEEWANEREFRWVYVGDGDGPIDVPVGEAIAGIVLGSDFDNSFHCQAKDLSEKIGVPILRLWWSNGFASPPWPLEAFDDDGSLQLWSKEAKVRRSLRKPSS